MGIGYTSTCINDEFEAMYDENDACKTVRSCVLEHLRDDTRADSFTTLTERKPDREVSEMLVNADTHYLP